MKRSPDSRTIGERNDQLIFTCGAVGMGVDFVTGNCVTAGGRQINPRNIAPPSPAHSNFSHSELIMRCGGRAVDFVTGRCM